MIRVEVAQHDTGVRNSRFDSAPSITGWPWHGSGAAWAHVQHSVFVNPRNAAAPGADALHVYGRKTDQMSHVPLADPRFPTHGNSPFSDQRHVVARSARVCDDRSLP